MHLTHVVMVERPLRQIARYWCACALAHGCIQVSTAPCSERVLWSNPPIAAGSDLDGHCKDRYPAKPRSDVQPSTASQTQAAVTQTVLCTCLHEAVLPAHSTQRKGGLVDSKGSRFRAGFFGDGILCFTPRHGALHAHSAVLHAEIGRPARTRTTCLQFLT